ncbi:uncharacterized protein LOC113494740 isoform X2 [Trichoplusia ni]|uniref:Uncharacterized protein LOC113494740 isoform X2 n=1 Tax=Trichoplusia ni TaxID=7111 RepID=A0A7E5VKY0_TRINI|nr:uncharacterized protein LOC113494740 isoform X2 [Trichoplusia ni]
MADEDEIDILGDFSFNSCFAQNNQGIFKEGSPRKLYGNKSFDKNYNDSHTAWSPAEREILIREMAKYGRNVRKISQTLKTKTEAEIQALIEAEYGVNLETPSFGLEKHEDHDNVPAVVQEEIVTDDVTSINNIINMVTTGAPTITMPKKPYRKKNNSKSLLKPNVLDKSSDLIAINPAEILHEDDLVIGSTESIGSDLELADIVSKNIVKYQAKVKAEKKIGNHRRKVSRNYDKGSRNKSKELLKSPPGRQRKDSSLSEDSLKSPKMQIVLGSGLALPVSEGEQVIKIEKKKDSEPESDIEIDVDSDSEGSSIKTTPKKEDTAKTGSQEAPIAVPLSRFEPMPKRHKKINLDGGGGYTIMHTEAGDLFAVGAEPRRERPPRKQHVQLLRCRTYSADRPAPFEVQLHVSTLLLMDAHGHTSRGEVMGLLGGARVGPALRLAAYRVARAAAGSTHCDMDPVSQSQAAESLRAAGLRVCGWQHSHPQFPAWPSALDLSSQRALQAALDWRLPFVGLITSQHWPTGRTASQYRCIRVEDDDKADVPTGYQFSVKLVPDLSAAGLAAFLQELRGVLLDRDSDRYAVDMLHDVCPQAKLTYLEKFISSATHHLRSAGYEDDDPFVKQVIQGIRDIFR